MVGKLNSPGIFVREVDNTAFAPTIDSSIVGIVGFADKGPVGKATLITNAEQLVRTFGEPNEDLPGQGLLAAIEILEATNRIYFARCADGTSEFPLAEASAGVQLGACPAVKINKAAAEGTDPLYLRISVSVNGELLAEPAILQVSSTELIYAENFLKYVGDGTASKDIFGAAYDPDFPNEPYIFASYAGKNVVLSLSAASSEDFLAGEEIECLQGVDRFGEPSGELVSSISVTGFDLTKNSLHYLVESLYPGKGYNYGISLKTGEVTGLSIEVDNVAGPWFNLYVNDKGFQSESFRLSLIGDNTFIGNVIKTSEAQTPLFSQYIKGRFAGTSNPNDGNPLKSVAEKLNSFLTYQVSAVSADNGTVAVSATPRFVKPLIASYPLVDGSNGLSDETSIFGGATGDGEGSAEDGTNSTLNSVVIGEPEDKTGIYALDDDNLNISIALVPGFTNQRIQNALITLAESSQNFIAAVAPPYGTATVQDAVNWMNGKSGLRTASINNSYVAVYWPWVQVFSVYDEKDRWLDPAIYAVRQMAFTDAVSEPWFAPAGFNRGRLSKPIDTEIILSQGDRDTLYDNNINPMVKFFPEGITIFGQKTAKRIPSATDRINVRRLMIYLRKTLLASSRSFVFEPNDSITWENIKGVCEDILRDIASRRGIAEYRVICDDTTNTPLRVSRRELWCKIILRPVEAAEYIIFEVNLTNNTSKLGA